MVHSIFSTPDTPGCSFTVAVSAAPVAQAEFDFTGSPYICQLAKVMGTYEAGKALTNENTVELELDIIEPGAFNISTETLDGILFSNSGTFTRKGIQTVILKGSGVQIQPMTLDFKPMSSTTECTFRVTVAYPGPPGPQATYVLVSSAGTPPLCFYQINGV